MKDDKTIIQQITSDESNLTRSLIPSVSDVNDIYDRQAALLYIGSRAKRTINKEDLAISFAEEILQKEVLPHLGFCATPATRTAKCRYLGYMSKRLLIAHASPDDTEITDRDHFLNKRVDMVGPLLGTIFRMAFKKLKGDLGRLYAKSIDSSRSFNIAISIMEKTITNALKYSIGKGTFGKSSIKRGDSTKRVRESSIKQEKC